MILQCLLSTDGYLIPKHFAYRLKEWTEIGFPELGNKACCGVGFTVGSVIGHPEFLIDPHKAAFDIWQSKGCDLAANGAVMRTAVLGTSLFFNEHQVVLNTINCAKVTHADPRCIFSSVVVSVLISRIFKRELEVGENYRIDDREMEKLLKITESKSSVCDNNADSPLRSTTQKFELSIAELCTPKPVLEEKPRPFFQSLWCKMVNMGQKSDNKWPERWPNHHDPDQSRIKTPAKCNPNKFSIETCGHDDFYMELIKEVLSDYNFLLNIKDEPKRKHWIVDVEKLCFPKTLSDIQLDEKASIGYTLKCLGSALYCFSRKEESDMKKGDFFMQVITELTLQAGDADTNCAVAGALLGGRLGMKGLPKVWMLGLRNREFLISISEQLVELVMKQLNSI